MAKKFHDGGMMPSGKGSHANMPTETVQKEYSNPHEYMGDDLDDGISGIDKQIGEDAGKRTKHTKPKKV